MRILHNDEYFIAINKEAGLAIQPDKTADTSLLDHLESELKQKMFLLNRLDRPVSGIVLFAKSKESAAILSKMLQSGEIKKTYLAAVHNKPKKNQGELFNFLNKRNFKAYVSKDPKQGKEARLNYRTIGNSEHYHFLEINLKTGRFHQIRVQLAAIGCPVKGDVKYGARRANKDRSIHLHAKSLEFVHPWTTKKLKLESELPIDPVWNAFLP